MLLSWSSKLLQWRGCWPNSANANFIDVDKYFNDHSDLRGKMCPAVLQRFCSSSNDPPPPHRLPSPRSLNH